MATDNVKCVGGTQPLSRFGIFKELRRHRKTAARRETGEEYGRVAKWAVWTGLFFTCSYLAFIATMLSLAVNSTRSVTPMGFIFSAMPVVLMVDFFARFAMQQTPAQMVKPYLLLPMPKAACVDSLVGTSLLSSGNFVWAALLVPYAVMSVVFVEGFWAAVFMLLLYYVAVLANSQWYAIVRTLVNASPLYWLLPATVYGLLLLPTALPGAKDFWEEFAETLGTIGESIDGGRALSLAAAIAVLALLVAVNRRVQAGAVWKEVAADKATKLRSVSHFAFLDNFGTVGAFVQLEAKSVMRNKAVRSQFILSVSATAVLAGVLSFTDVYDGTVFSTFWCFYAFQLFGLMGLARIMGAEGNYIEALMVRHEKIMQLLMAKYAACSALLLLPFTLLLPTVFTGKWDLLMLLSYGVFTAGVTYFLLFQGAVYNRQSMPLNTKATANRQTATNYTMSVFQIVCSFLPMSIALVLKVALGDTWSDVVLLAVGAAFIAASPLWIRNIYNRMMRRKYSILEGLVSTR